MVAPISIDIFVSGLPAISQYFHGTNVSLILGMSLLGLAFSQPIYGPLLDKFGRKPVLLFGLLVFSIASLVIATTNSFNILILGRFVQAIGACCGVVSSFAIVKDVYEKEKMVYAIGMIMAMIGISPVIAPLIGSFLTNYFSWRASFFFLFIMGLTYLFIIAFVYKETLTAKNKDALRLSSIISNYWLLLKLDGFVLYCLSNGFTYCILFSYINISAFLIIKEMGYSIISYGWIVSSNALIIILMAKLAPYVSSKITIIKTLILGLFIIAIGGAAMIFASNIYGSNIFSLMVPVLITTIGAGIIRPIANAGAMQLSPKNIAGSASAMFNFITFVMGAVASTYSLRYISNILDFGVFILVFGLIPVLFWILAAYFRKSRLAVQ